MGLDNLLFLIRISIPQLNLYILRHHKFKIWTLYVLLFRQFKGHALDFLVNKIEIETNLHYLLNCIRVRFHGIFLIT